MLTTETLPQNANESLKALISAYHVREDGRERKTLYKVTQDAIDVIEDFGGIVEEHRMGGETVVLVPKQYCFDGHDEYDNVDHKELFEDWDSGVSYEYASLEFIFYTSDPLDYPIAIVKYVRYSQDNVITVPRKARFKIL